MTEDNIKEVNTPTNLEHLSTSGEYPQYIGDYSQNSSLAGLVLGNLSVPPEVIEEFFPWTSEITTTSNLDERDIQLIVAIFEEFFEVYNMIIPERYKNRSLSEIYEKFGPRVKENPTLQKIKMLVNSRIQLKKSKHGFLIDKLTTSKQVSQMLGQDQEKKRFSFLPGR